MCQRIAGWGLCLILIMGLRLSDGHAQDPPRPAPGFVHHQWTTADDLPVNTLNRLARGPQGYLWATTYDGLVRFDGLRVEVLRTSTHPALASNRLVDMVRGPDDHLWITTEQGVLLRFDPRTEAVRSFSLDLPLEDPNGIQPRRLRPRLLATETALWVGTPGGLLRAPAGRDTLEAMGPRDWVVVDLVARNDTVWVATRTHGLQRYADGAFTRLRIRGPGVAPGAPGDLLALHIAPDKTVWLAIDLHLFEVTNSALIRRTPSGWTEVMRTDYGHLFSHPSGDVLLGTLEGFHRFAPTPTGRLRPTGTRQAVPHARLRRLSVRDAQGEPWMALDTTLYVGTTPVLRTGGPITSLLADREGNVWVAAERSGLHRVRRSPVDVYGETDGIASPNIYPVVENATRPGAVWAGTLYGDGLMHIDEGTVRSYGDPSRYAFPRIVWSLLSNPDGTLWMGTESGLFALRNDAVDYPAGLPDLLRQRQARVFALHEDRRGTRWIGSANGLFTWQAGHWSRISEEKGAPHATVRVIHETDNGALWMGTNGGGVVRYLPGSGRFEHLDTHHAMPSTLIRSLHEDADGFLWIGTEDQGLVRLDRRGTLDLSDDRIAHVGTDDGLFDDVIHQIVPDDQGRLWMSTNRGLFWVKRSNLHAVADGTSDVLPYTAYTEQNGLPSREANGGVHSAGTRTSDGRLWFPTQRGLVVIDPTRIQPNTRPPPVLIETVTAGDRLITAADLHDRDVLHLQPDQRTLSIRYTGLSLRRPNDLRFRYRFGDTDAWTHAGRQRTAQLVDLSPGTYTFEVKAANGSGVWSTTPARLTLVVRPRWWETRWFWGGVALCIVGAIAGAFRLRMRWLEEQRHRLQKTVAERTVEVREQNKVLSTQTSQLAEQAERLRELDAAKSRFFANISHELRTPLTLILGPVRWAKEAVRSSRVQKQLTVAERNARQLQRLVDQLLSLAQLDAGVLQVRARPVSVARAVQRLGQAFSRWIERSGLTFTFQHVSSDRSANDPVYADPNHLDQMIGNLLANAIKFTPEGGQVRAKVDEHADAVVLVVTDTGSGMNADEQAQAFQRFGRSTSADANETPGLGLGLALTRDLVELHSGTLALDSTKGEGTTVTLSLPRGHDHFRPDQVMHAASSDAPEDEATDAHSRPGAPPASPGVRRESPDADGPLTEAPPPCEHADATRLLLVVDDHASVRNHVRTVLGDAYRIAEAANGAEGLQKAQSLLPDLVLADVMMPEMDGLTMTQTLKSNATTASIPVVLLTARGGTKAEVEGLNVGADDYITKPFDPRVLEARVRGMFALQERLRERLHAERAAERPGPEPARKTTADPSADEASWLQAARAVVVQHVADDAFSVEDLADALDVSRSTLYRRLKQHADTSPSAFVRTVRLEEAAQLLDAGEGSVTEIAYAVGYGSLAAFSRAFRKHMGSAPSDYGNAPSAATHTA